MDPRHPELAISRIDELMAQYKRIIRDMQTCNISSKLAQSEREGGLVVQEICLVAPRLHDAMIQVSRTRRAALAHGIVEENPMGSQYEKMRDYAEVIGEENIGGESGPMEKSEPTGEKETISKKETTTKKTTKKKTTKKVKK